MHNIENLFILNYTIEKSILKQLQDLEFSRFRRFIFRVDETGNIRKHIADAVGFKNGDAEEG